MCNDLFFWAKLYYYYFASLRRTLLLFVQYLTMHKFTPAMKYSNYDFEAEDALFTADEVIATQGWCYKKLTPVS